MNVARFFNFILAISCFLSVEGEGLFDSGRKRLAIKRKVVENSDCSVKYSSAMTWNCFAESRSYQSYPDQTLCYAKDHVSRSGETALVVCNNGEWRRVSSVKQHNKGLRRRKRWGRFFRGIFRGIARAVGSVVRAVGGLICNLFCSSRSRDTTPPSLKCPGSIVQNAKPIQTYAHVTWAEPYADDNEDGSIRATASVRGPGVYDEGVHHLGYYARDNAGNMARCSFTVTIKVVRCPTPTAITNGYRWSWPLSAQYLLGVKAYYWCYEGFERVDGNTVLECGENGNWEGTVPRCQKVTCPSLLAPPKSSISCDADNTFNSICIYTCYNGYRVGQGVSRVRICKADRTWTGSEPECKDAEKPVINGCPGRLVVYADRTTEAMPFGTPVWADPVVTDNSGENIIPDKIKGPASGQSLPPGRYPVIYTAKDSQGNYAIPCVFEVILKAITCISIHPTPYLEVTCPAGTYYGATCSFACEQGNALIGNEQATCNRQGEPPYGEWDWGDTRPICKGVPCSPLHTPKHGALACDRWLYGKFCQMLCNEKYDVRGRQGNLDEGFLYVCGDSGSWSGLNPNVQHGVPDCTKKYHPRVRRRLSTLHYYAGECPNEEDQEALKSQFIEVLKKSLFADACTDQCFIENVEIRCGENSRKRRDLAENGVDLEVKFKMVVSGSNDNSSDILNQMAEGLANQVKNNSLQMNNVTGNVSLNLDPNSLNVGSEQIVCEEGQEPSSPDSCVGCAPGSFYNSSSSSCDICPKGSYQPNGTQTSCLPCPNGTSTANQGAKDVQECLSICEQGSFSSTGVVPCSLCAKGSYQHHVGQTFCNTCPPNTATEEFGALSSQECKSFDFIFAPYSNTSSWGKVSTKAADLSNGLSVSFWIQANSHLSDNITLITLNVFRDNNITDMIMMIGLMHNQFVLDGSYGCGLETSAFVDDSRWHHYIVSIQLPTETVKVYHNDQLLETNTDCKLLDTLEFNENDTFSVTFGSVQKRVDDHEGNTTSISLSNINIWNTTLDEVHVQNLGLCNSSLEGNVLSWREASEADVVGAFLLFESQCDDLDSCESAPCGNHTCVDSLDGFECICILGFTGKFCETNIDDCTVSVCQNNATCIDGVQNYTCQCKDNFYGDLCEMENIHGNWSLWSNWSSCSTTCGGGNATRWRYCDSPAPENGGENCTGDDMEMTICNQNACPVCDNITAPENGYLECNSTGFEDEVLCKMYCNSGYDFTEEPLSVYECGPSTFHVWNYKTDDNPTGRLPACEAVKPPKEINLGLLVKYKDMDCSNADDVSGLLELLRNTTEANLELVPCIVDQTCVMSHYEVLNCGDGIMSDTVSIQLQLKPVDSIKNDVNNYTTDEELNRLESNTYDLEVAGVVFKALINNGSFTIYTNDNVYVVATNESNPTGNVGCEPGEVQVSFYCVACAAGTFSTGKTCDKCDYGYYLNSSGQLSCEPCPEFFTTKGRGSISINECIFSCPEGYTNANGTCKKCDIGYYKNVSGHFSCEKCPEGLTTLFKGAASVIQCTEPCWPGTFNNGTLCEECDYGYYQNVSAQDSCMPCRDNYTTIERGSVDQSNCKLTCPPGSHAVADLCKLCDYGYFKNISGYTSCQQCPVNLTTLYEGAVLSSECTDPCSPGTFNNGAVCEDCHYGYYQNISWQNECIPCPDNYTTAERGSVHQSDCKLACPPGSHAVVAQCQQCNYGYYKNFSGYLPCQHCPGKLTTLYKGARYVSECTDPCSPGTFNNGTSCQDCDYGYYQSAWRQSSCLPCPENYTTAERGSMGQSDCKLICPSGSHAEADLCKLCDYGYYKNVSGYFPCQQCPENLTTLYKGASYVSECTDPCSPGTFNNGTSCQDCDYGYYQNISEQNECMPCPDNYTTAERGSVDQSDCKLICPSGLHAVGDQCKLCDYGYYKNVSGYFSCQRCPENLTTLYEGTMDVSDCTGTTTLPNYQRSSDAIGNATTESSWDHSKQIGSEKDVGTAAWSAWLVPTLAASILIMVISIVSVLYIKKRQLKRRGHIHVYADAKTQPHEQYEVQSSGYDTSSIRSINTTGSGWWLTNFDSSLEQTDGNSENSHDLLTDNNPPIHHTFGETITRDTNQSRDYDTRSCSTSIGSGWLTGFSKSTLTSLKEKGNGVEKPGTVPKNNVPPIHHAFIEDIEDFDN